MPPHYLKVLLKHEGEGYRSYKFIVVRLGFSPTVSQIEKIIEKIESVYKDWKIKKYWIRSFHRGVPDFVFNHDLEVV